MAGALFILRLPFALRDPYFYGDGGYRLHYANNIIFFLGDRVWLPFLQLHIHIFYKFHLPYVAFKLIPCAYFLLALLFLAKLTYRIMAKMYAGSLFTFLILLAFSYQSILFFLSVGLFQEMAEIAFFYLLLYLGALELKKSRMLLFMASIALFVRETFWVYLLVLTIINYKRIFSDKVYRLVFLWFWSLVAGWFFVARAMSFARVKSLSRWPLMINTSSSGTADLFAGLRSLGSALYVNRTHYIIAGLIMAWVLRSICVKTHKMAAIESDSFDVKFKVFSSLSLGILYSYVILFNPWEKTPGNPRMGVCLLSHIFIWTALFFKESFRYPKALKMMVRVLLVLALLLTMTWNKNCWIPKDRCDDFKAYADIEALGRHAAYGRRPNVCFLAISEPDAFKNLVAPTLYMRRKFLYNKNDAFLKECDIVVSASNFGFEDERFLKHKEYRLGGKGHAFYVRRGAR
jgi:hypothetical protein